MSQANRIVEFDPNKFKHPIQTPSTDLHDPNFAPYALPNGDIVTMSGVYTPRKVLLNDAHVAQFRTAEQKKLEIQRCRKDPIYFIKNYIYIQNKVKGRMLYDMYPYQEQAVTLMHENVETIFLKGRQAGLSTSAAAYAIWLANFHKDKSILCIATKLYSAVNFIKKVKYGLKLLPSWMRSGSFTSSKTTVEFSNGSEIIAIPTSEDAGRSDSVSFLVIDEAAFINNYEDLFSQLSATLSTGGKCCIISTPSGEDHYFHTQWKDAVTGASTYKPFLITWRDLPTSDFKWYSKFIRNNSQRKFRREYECVFDVSGEVYVDPDIIEELLKQTKPEMSKIFVGDEDEGDIKIWQMPEEGVEYVMGCDVARGDVSGDASTSYIVRRDTQEVVAQICVRIRPDKFAVLLNQYGRQYNNALMVVESNTYGSMVLMKMEEMKYPNMFFSDFEALQNYREGKKWNMKKCGFSTQKASRAEVLSRMEEWLRNKKITIPCVDFVTELRTFVWIKDKPQAKKGYYDDLIMAFAIAVYGLSTEVSSGDGVQIDPISKEEGSLFVRTNSDTYADILARHTTSQKMYKYDENTFSLVEVEMDGVNVKQKRNMLPAIIISSGVTKQSQLQNMMGRRNVRNY